MPKQDELDELRTKLINLSMTSMGPSPFFNDVKNGLDIAKVIDLVGNLYSILNLLNKGEIDPSNIGDFKELFAQDDPMGAEKTCSSCLATFQASAIKEATGYIDSIKRLYKEALAEITDALDKLSPSQAAPKRE
jgi:hypothetical protein